MVLPTVSAQVSIEIEEAIWDGVEDFHGLSNVVNTGLEMTTFAELTVYEGEVDTRLGTAAFVESWKMINNTMLERGIGELISRNQNITLRVQGTRRPDKENANLFDRILAYMR